MEHTHDETCNIYGVDIHEEITPLKVRDAIIRCFIMAHKNELQEFILSGGKISPEEFERMEKIYIERLVKNFFSETGGDFDHPTKSSILKALDKLADFARNFRDQSVVLEHYQKIMKLIEKLN